MQINAKNGKRQALGFTMVEMLIVLVILGLLAGLVGPRVIKYLGDSKTKTAKLQIVDLSASMDLFLLDNGRYPTPDEGLDALVKQPVGLDSWSGPYLSKSSVPLDPWGEPYILREINDPPGFAILSLGADKSEGGDGENQDVSNLE